MSMERHRCKVCSKIFLNGRALGGHMRSHLATLPLPPRKKTQEHEKFQLGDRTESDSSSTRSDHETRDEKMGSYELRENPKRSAKGSDPEFLDAGSVVVQDRESETESTQNPTRRRSKRAGQRGKQNQQGGGELKRCKWGGSESPAESTPVSSVSDPSQDEEVALCLMMLSRDAWERVSMTRSIEDTHDSAAELKASTTTSTRPTTTTRTAKFKCSGCKKVFRTGRALAGHRASNKECCQENSGTFDHHQMGQKIFECPFCYKVFGSGQALGGHKRSHLLGSSTNNNINNNIVNNVTATSNVNSNADKVGDSTTSFCLDLNLPAPVEDDDDHITIPATQLCTFSSTRVEVE